MKYGSQSGAASMGEDIWGNIRSGCATVPSARRTGPPRSNSQYHRPTAITLVIQIEAPEASSVAADEVLGSTSMIARISSTAETAFAAVISRIIVMLAIRVTGPRRSIRPGV